MARSFYLQVVVAKPYRTITPAGSYAEDLTMRIEHINERDLKVSFIFHSGTQRRSGGYSFGMRSLSRFWGLPVAQVGDKAGGIYASGVHHHQTLWETRYTSSPRSVRCPVTLDGQRYTMRGVKNLSREGNAEVAGAGFEPATSGL